MNLQEAFDVLQDNQVDYLLVQNINITVSEENFDDYVCITDIAKAKIGESRGADVVKNWLQNTRAE